MRVFSVAERPDLVEPGWRMPSSLPAFMMESQVAERLMGRLPDLFPDLRLVAVEDGPDGEQVVAHLHAVAFTWDGDDASLPDRGWEGILEQAVADADAGRPATAVSLLEASVRAADRAGPATDCRTRPARPVRPGPAEREAPGATPVDGRLRACGPGGRAAGGPVDAGARPARRPGGEGLPGLDEPDRDGGAVAVLERAAAGPQR
jgi:hypothetical protein